MGKTPRFDIPLFITAYIKNSLSIPCGYGYFQSGF